MRSIIAIAAALAADTATAQVAMTKAEQAITRQAIERGALMYHYDQAAWHGTDAMKRDMGGQLDTIGGWIVDGPAEAPQIVFVDKDQNEPHAVYIADLHDDRLVSGHIAADSEKPLTPMRKRMVNALRLARDAIIAAKIRPCTPASFNTIVIPPPTPESPVAVYFLSPQNETQTIPLGGHYLVEVGANGIAAPPRPFTNTCLNMTPPPAAQGQPGAMVVSQILTPTPTEIHVFSTLAAQRPAFVITQTGLWMVAAPDKRPAILLVKRRIQTP